ncbi:amidohydrolase family protein [Ferrimicrobium sp.]|uniref:amidohydrolase family protein n=1 Tax=Ferrimicrobium sp. TaxID=2926050 RepID=UPI00260F32AB|nr:amidohydrolase family protein [Ferrimicrobium sp.]
MRIVAIEEHFAPKDLEAARGGSTRYPNEIGGLLDEVSERRIADMDRNGISFQVLASTPPNAASASEATKWNDRLATIIAAHPDRFGGFASLSTPEPDSCPSELERAVKDLGFVGALIHGHANGVFCDSPTLYPTFAKAEELGVPIYLHPTPPVPAVFNAYYSDLKPEVAQVLSTSGWGWHAETGLHALRLIVSGIFERFPQLQIIIGHMGENLPFSLARAEATLGRVTPELTRPISQTFCENFYVTTSGYFTLPPLLCAAMVVGVDRLIFSVDYPFARNEDARAFLDTVPLSLTDRHKIAHGNVEGLLSIPRGVS